MRKGIAVFIASPGDLAGERKVFKETIDTLNGGFGDGAGVAFEPLGWEDILAETGRRTQDVINQDIEQCDLFILVLHRRWGQDATDSKFSSYTEEEFELALSRWENNRSPEIIVFFKNVDAASIADPGPELKKVLAFKKKLEKGKSTMFRTFNTEAQFGQEIDKHLRAFAHGEWQHLDRDTHEVALPEAALDKLGKANREGAKRVERAEKLVSSSNRDGKGESKQALVAKADLSLVKAYQEELALARAAAEAADDGRIQDATILFAKATEGTTNPSILALAAEFFRQVGDVENASRLVRRQTAITKDRTVAAQLYLSMLPPGRTTMIRQQMAAGMLADLDPEIAQEFNSILQEVFEEGRVEKFMLDLYVKHFSTEELTHFARFLGTAEGQSSMEKQQLVTADVMNFAKSEVERVMQKRAPRFEQLLLRKSMEAAAAEIAEPKQLSSGDAVGESAVAARRQVASAASKKRSQRRSRVN
jgi:hypothetical protein